MELSGTGIRPGRHVGKVAKLKPRHSNSVQGDKKTSAIKAMEEVSYTTEFVYTDIEATGKKWEVGTDTYSLRNSNAAAW
jgi:hypothetical protein